MNWCQPFKNTRDKFEKLFNLLEKGYKIVDIEFIEKEDNRDKLKFVLKNGSNIAVILIDAGYMKRREIIRNLVNLIKYEVGRRMGGGT